MSRGYLGVLCVFAALCGCSDSRPGGPAAEGAGGDVAPDERYAAVADGVRSFIETEMADKGLPAVAIALVDDQDVVWAEGFGYERIQDSIPATATTVFRVGSVSKLFTDLAIMRQVEQGNLDLDAPITAVLPAFTPTNPFGGDITLRQLTSHRAGLVREPPVGHYFDDTEPTLDATVASLAATELVYAPEARSKYSNAGIAVVGQALSTVTGEPFSEHLQTRILDPLGMGSSSFEATAAVRARLADAEMWTIDGRTFDAPTWGLGMSPAGSMYSTVIDLGRFMSALFEGGEVVEAATLESMWTPQFAPAGATEGFGIGFAVGELDGHRSVGHGGAIYGFSTELLALPEERLGVVVTTSLDVTNTVMARIAEGALRAALAARSGGAWTAPVPPAPVGPERAERLEGRYSNGDGTHAFDLLELGHRLYLEPAGGGMRVELKALGDTLIVDDRRAYGRRLVQGAEGLRDRDQLVTRVDVPEPAPAPARWQGLIGEYGWDHNVLYVLEQEGRLTALIEWFFQYPLVEEGPDHFRFPQGGLYPGESLVFERDASGRATQALLAGSVVFERRAIDGESDATFKIDPVRPVDDLRAEALAAQPPVEPGDFVESDLVEVTALDGSVELDIRYASSNNFMDSPFYDEPRAFLQRPAAEALVRAHQRLGAQGLGLLIHDGYRPWYVTKMFWDATPEEQKLFVADPASGSRHNRGAAVDLTLYRRSNGQPVRTVSGYDEFSPRAFPDYPGGTAHQRWLREVLREAMEDEGFDVYEWEWWHFDYGDWARYPISNATFDRIGTGQQ